MQIQPAITGSGQKPAARKTTPEAKKANGKQKVINTPSEKTGVLKYDGDARIQLAAPKNPKRVGCSGWKRFNLYKNGMKIKDFIKAGGKTIDLDWDRERGFIATEDRDKVGSQSKSPKATFNLK
tara:strand:- start:2456 stop:2827 length:372 start_codon:yes stop_codon:yes gene_type:complete